MSGTVLICDDHPLVRLALVQTVGGLMSQHKVIEAGDFTQAVSLAAGVDICISDLSMPGAAPLEGAASLLGVLGSAPLIIVTASADDATMLDLIEMGVAGFLPKTATMSVIRAAIDVVLAGERYIPSRLIELLQRRPVVSAAGSSKLTDQQIRILPLLASGLTNKEIARAIGVAPSTIKTHIEALFRILGANTRQGAVSAARARGMLD